MPIDEPVATTSVAVAEEALVEEPVPSTSASNMDESSAAEVTSTSVFADHTQASMNEPVPKVKR